MIKLLSVLPIVWIFVLFSFTNISYATNIQTVADLDGLESIINISWTNNSMSKLFPPGNTKYNNDLGIIAYEDGFETNFLAQLIAVTNETGTGTNFVLRPVKITETTNGSDRVRYYLSELSTNPIAIYTTTVSIAGYPESWIEETYGEPPAWLVGDELDLWYSNRDRSCRKC